MATPYGGVPPPVSERQLFGMVHVVLLRGVNVGGHKTFRPSVVAGKLRRFGVANVGAAGTFVVRNSPGQTELREAFARLLPFETTIMICPAADVRRLAALHPLEGQANGRDTVPFVSLLAKNARPRAALPQVFPATGPWGVRIVGQIGRFVYGVYKREMRAINNLAQVDRLFGVPATTRNWNTIAAIVGILEQRRPLATRSDR